MGKLIWIIAPLFWIVVGCLAQAQTVTCRTRNDGVGDKITECSDGSSSITRRDGIGGEETTYSPPWQPSPHVIEPKTNRN